MTIQNYTDEQVLSAIEALGSYETMRGFAHILASVHDDRKRLQAKVQVTEPESAGVLLDEYRIAVKERSDALGGLPLTRQEDVACMRAALDKCGFAARLSQGAQGESSIGDLLAIIHRDGGHYQSEHGTEKAARDAIDVVHAMKQQVAECAAVPDGRCMGDVQCNRYLDCYAKAHGEPTPLEAAQSRIRELEAMLTAAPQPPEGARVVASMNDETLCNIAENYGAEICWANDPDQFHHIITLTPPQLRSMLLAAPTLAGKEGAE